ncbi:MAG: hypothetical protein GF388_05070 [Candidatus Aegiribacteria sp.]|nr:hypothetical protein [Candidatus Aegiribacteria sp.]MBD3294590.1 hypothetical protein [Candidatus Fermentibacteria bacterium]
MRTIIPVIIAVLTAILGCGGETAGTAVRIRNETRFTITDVVLSGSRDTLIGDTVRSSCQFEGRMVLASSERVRLSWTENGEGREFEIALLDSVNKADVVLISILPGNQLYEVFYRF